MGMLHRQAILARSKEMLIHELQIQDSSIGIIERVNGRIQTQEQVEASAEIRLRRIRTCAEPNL
jgi:hypothetical protein